MTKHSSQEQQDFGLKLSNLSNLFEAIKSGRKLQLFLFLITLAGIVYWRCLPAVLFADPWSSLLIDRDGKLLDARVASDAQWRFPLTKSVPEKFAVAIINYEDKRFYYHPGVDPLALARAIKLNIKHNSIHSGASTLSMQVIRLSRKNPERSYTEKLYEMILATRLEWSYSKAEILSLYAAHAPFGGNVVGLEAAAWRYFGRDAALLSWSEAATLAVLPNSPGLIHPGRSRKVLQKKRDALLLLLHQRRYIDGMQYQLALAEPLIAAPKPLPHLAPHLLATLEAQQQPGLRFKTTLDANLQAAVSQLSNIRSHNYSNQGINNIAAIVIDNQSMNVLAYVGNRDYQGADEIGQYVDIIQAPRSTGSILKPFLYLQMLEYGELTPKTLVADVPIHINGFKPNNYDKQYKGAVAAEKALAQSLNIPAVLLLKRHGVARFKTTLQQLGLSTIERSADDYGLSLILGGAEANLGELAGLYANMSNTTTARSTRNTAQQQQANLLLKQKQTSTPTLPYSAASAYLTLSALLEVNRPELENYWRQFNHAKKIAWKTGTSYGLRDGWAIGTTPEYTVGVWVGNADGEGRAGLTGTGMAAPLMFDIFNRLPLTTWFEAPYEQMKAIKVCRENGYLPRNDCKTIETWIPQHAHFQMPTPHHQRIFTDASGHRVHSQCAAINEMKINSWFVLPPSQEYYFRQLNSGYKRLPTYRPDCLKSLAMSDQAMLEIIYPATGTTLYIPKDFGGLRQQVIFKAVHRDTRATLHWHIDNRYLGETEEFHSKAFSIKPGAHQLTIVDNAGRRRQSRFRVLAQ